MSSNLRLLFALICTFVYVGNAHAEEAVAPPPEEVQTDAPNVVSEPADADPATDDQEKGEEKPAHKYIRISRDDDEQPIAMETSVVILGPTGEKYQGVTVELVGAVHVGDVAYYEKLNKLFESYDVLLFELVAPEGTKIPKGGRKPSGSAIGALQGGMSSVLELQHQLQQVDYTKENFVHADMSPEEFAESMKERGESFFQMFLKSLGQSTVAGAGGKQSISDADLFFALFAKDRALRLKRLVARQFENMESQMSIFDGEEGSTIITERNKKCFEVLTKELENGHKRIGIFYGAGHLADMEKRLGEDFQMTRSGEKWIVAWDLKPKEKEESPAQEDEKIEEQPLKKAS